MKRVAICLSGYARKYDHTIKNFNDLLINPIKEAGYEVDIFFSTWDKLNSNTCCSAVNNAAGYTDFGTFNLDDILEKFQPKKYIVGNFEGKKQEFNILNYDKTLDLNTLQPILHENGVLFNLTQYYHRLKANELKCQYEQENGFVYDIVILMRFDLFFLKKFDISKIDKEKVSMRTYYNDAFLVSSSENIDKIAQVYPNIQNIVNKYGRNKVEWLDFYSPEYFLENHYKEIGITRDRMVELGEDTFFYYPRNNFIGFCNHIYNAVSRPHEINYVIDYLNKI